LERDGLWWTGLGILIATCAILITPALLLREPIAIWTLGPELASGGFFYLLALCTLALTTLEQLLQAHLRVYKQSALFVKLSLGRLALNIALNLYLLLVRDMGVAAILWGNLISAAVSLAALFVAFVRKRGPARWRSDLVGDLFAYGVPLIVASLLAVAMHQLDRYLLRVLLDLDQVGLYSVAYAIGQGINTLMLQPFSQIWYVVIYELEGKPELREAVRSVFRYFFSVLVLVMLGVSLFAEPLVWLLVAPEFYPAADLIPLVCLAYLFFSLHAHFNLPPLLAKKTTWLIPAHVVGVVVNLAANLLLIPAYGTRGAALASVVTFAAFSFSGLVVYRRIDRFDYPLAAGLAVLVGISASYAAWSWTTSWSENPLSTGVLAAAIWLVWAALLLWPLLRSREIHIYGSEAADG
jgi:O-antigen/teichoic acid export membrane protein